MVSGSVVALFLKPAQGVSNPVSKISVLADMGFEGDMHCGWNERKALFISTEDIDAFGYVPGQLQEQVTVTLPGLQTLPVGTRVKVGSVSFEVEQDCAPCVTMAKRLGEDPKSFVRKTMRRRGMFLIPRESGEIQVGDAVILEGV
jgi:MOSC domain-containing protein YiiM